MLLLLLANFLLEHAPERIDSYIDLLLAGHTFRGIIAYILVEKTGRRYENKPFSAFLAETDPWHHLIIGRSLAGLDAPKYHDLVLGDARASLKKTTEHRFLLAEEMINVFGKEVLPDIVAILGDPSAESQSKDDLLKQTVKAFDKESLPAVEAALTIRDCPRLRLYALKRLVAWNHGSHDSLIQSSLIDGLQESDSEAVTNAIELVARWKVPPLAENLRRLLRHESKNVRDVATRALATLGDDAIACAADLLENQQSDVRLTAVTLLTSINSSKAIDVLKNKVDTEACDDVRDAIFEVVEMARIAQDPTITKKDIRARMVRAAPKFNEQPASWINEAELPPLKFRDGSPLDKQMVRYLLYRQSRAKEMCPDFEAKQLCELIDRQTSGDFALQLLQDYLETNTDEAYRWVLTLACMLGDDRIVPLLSRQIRKWADNERGKMAEYAVQALALLGTDTALLAISFIAVHCRHPYGQAAQDVLERVTRPLGITSEELGERIMPTLGFEAGKPCIITCGTSSIEVRIDLDFELKYHDCDKNQERRDIAKIRAGRSSCRIRGTGRNSAQTQ